MAKYRVRVGAVIGHAGSVHQEGAVLELPRAIAEDQAVRGLVDEVDDKGQIVAPRPVDELERFRTHERVGYLRERLAAAQADVDRIAARLAAEEQRLADDVAATARAAKAPARAPKE